MANTSFGLAAVPFRYLASVLAVIAAPPAQAAAFCVETAAELRDALAAVSDGGSAVDEHNYIRIAEGVYLTGGEPFRSDALTSTGELNIEGGWRPNCTSLTPRGTHTVLDAQGSGGVLIINRPHGLVSVMRMTLQNGKADVGAGLRINYGMDSAAIIGLTQLLIRNNHATGDGGGAYVFGGAPWGWAPIHLYSSMFVDNSSGGEGGGAYMRITGGGFTRGSHVTIAGNVSTKGTTGGLYLAGDQGYYRYYAFNIWGNAPNSLYLGTAPGGSIDWSNIDTFTATAPPVLNNVVNEDPVFADPANGDYHLGTGTPFLRYYPDVSFVAWDVAGLRIPTYGDPYNAEIGALMETILWADNEP